MNELEKQIERLSGLVATRELDVVKLTKENSKLKKIVTAQAQSIIDYWATTLRSQIKV
jgi:hypothetical protein